MPELLKPGRIGKLNIRNRIVMSPMETQLCRDGFVTELHKDYFEARARGGAGMIIVPPAAVTYPVGAGHRHITRLDNDRFIPGYSQLARVIQKHGARAVLQLMHMGPGEIFEETHRQPVAASAVARPPDYTHPTGSSLGYSLPRELSVGEIADIVACYAKAAERAQKAGFDGVELNAAHRYLLNSFLSPYWNRRHDNYGGDLENRARILLEIISATRHLVGNDYPFWCRINGIERNVEGGVTPALAQELAKLLEDAGVDAIDVSSMHPHSPDYPPGFNVDLAAGIKKVVSIPVMTVGRIGPQLGEKVLQQKKADFICIGRALIADPELPNKAASGKLEDITPCVYCNSCLGLERRDCTVNAARGREQEFTIKSAEKPKIVLVVGGGPGGMEAARVAALRGHQVVLYEKEHRLGGQLKLASILRQENEALTKYLSTQIKKLGVKIELGKEVNSTLIAEIKPEAIVLATGATSALPEIPGIDRDNVLSGADIQGMMHGRLSRSEVKKRVGIRRLVWYIGFRLMGTPLGHSVMRRVLSFWIPLGKKVVVVGRRLPGVEMANFLADRGKLVTIVDTRDGLPLNEPPMPVFRQFLEGKLSENGVRVLNAVGYEEISDKGLTIINEEGERETIEGDTIVFASDYKPKDEISPALAGMPYEVYRVGDCNDPCGILEAIHAGSRIGRAI
ncbi:FAD-dependent oxidoreductase [Chloroflexota bacterium]